MSKITQSAKGEDCQVRIPGICNHNPETTVFAHINGGGMGMKQPDSEGAYCCSACHDVLDGRAQVSGLVRDMGGSLANNRLRLYHHEGAMRTRKILIDKGLLVLK